MKNKSHMLNYDRVPAETQKRFFRDIAKIKNEMINLSQGNVNETPKLNLV